MAHIGMIPVDNLRLIVISAISSFTYNYKSGCAHTIHSLSLVNKLINRVTSSIYPILSEYFHCIVGLDILSHDLFSPNNLPLHGSRYSQHIFYGPCIEIMFERISYFSMNKITPKISSICIVVTTRIGLCMWIGPHDNKYIRVKETETDIRGHIFETHERILFKIFPHARAYFDI